VSGVGFQVSELRCTLGAYQRFGDFTAEAPRAQSWKIHRAKPPKLAKVRKSEKTFFFAPLASWRDNEQGLENYLAQRCKACQGKSNVKSVCVLAIEC
jgi:hypothetical protein